MKGFLQHYLFVFSIILSASFILNVRAENIQNDIFRDARCSGCQIMIQALNSKITTDNFVDAISVLTGDKRDAYAIADSLS